MKFCYDCEHLQKNYCDWLMAFLDLDLIKKPCDCDGYKRKKAKERSLLEFAKA